MPQPVRATSGLRVEQPWGAASITERPGHPRQTLSDYRAAGGPRREPRALADELLGLSAVVAQLRRICARVPEDLYLQQRLAAVIGQLEAVGAELLSARERPVESEGNTSPMTSTAGAAAPAAAPRVSKAGVVDIAAAEAEEAFLDWLGECTDRDPAAPSRVAAPDRRRLGELSGSTRRLPARAVRALALPTDATVGDAAVQILLAVHDPSGARCTTYTEAVRFIAEHPDLLAPH